MLPLFWRSQYFKLAFSLFILFLLLFYSRRAYSQEKRPPGLIESFQYLINEHKENYKSRIEEIKSSRSLEVILSKNNIKDAQIDPEFLKSIFLHSEIRYLDFVQYNKCHFLSLLDNNLLRISSGEIRQIPLLIGKEKKPLLVSKKDFLEKSYKVKCKNEREISKLFTRENIKSTISGLSFKTPKNEKECLPIIADWKSNPYLPYLCKIPEAIRVGRKNEIRLNNLKTPSLSLSSSLRSSIDEYKWYRNNISFAKRSYLKGLCKGLSDKKFFCSSQLKGSIWAKAISGDRKKEKLEYKCRNLFGKDKITTENLRSCALKLTESPDTCTNKTANGFPSLYPRENCQQISQALDKSQLRTNYHDCPAHVDNIMMTHIHRLIMHLTKGKLKSSSKNCAAQTLNTFYNLKKSFDDESTWPLKICYFDKVESKEICHNYIPGQLKGIGISEEDIVTKTVKRLYPVSRRTQCKIIDEKEFRPNLLEFKNGCYIVVNSTECNSAFCARRIVVDEKEAKGIDYRGKNTLSLLPIKHSKRKFSAINMIREVYDRPSKRINNLTELDIFLSKNPAGIIHGIGCAEDLHSNRIRSRSFNTCTPMPFIVDSVKRKRGNKLLSIRTSIEDVHSPRTIPWNFVFSSLAGFRNSHPLNTWALYGIK